jgi:hypothetical protein
MNHCRTLLALVAALAATCGSARTPPFDSSPAFFSGDWIGSGADDLFCYVQLNTDGSGTVLVSGGSGDWLGARIQWRNDRQHIVLVDQSPMAANPQRRLMPLAPFLLRSGINRTLQLLWNESRPFCGLQLGTDVQRRSKEAQTLLETARSSLGLHDLK